jgi:flagellar L-ring protein precursor FlgH
MRPLWWSQALNDKKTAAPDFEKRQASSMRMAMKKFVLFTLTAFALVLGGCSAANRAPAPMPPIVPPQAYTEPELKQNNPGSIYSLAESADLYADNRAHQVGDIVLVKIVETSKSKTKADTTADRSSDSSIGVAAAFGKNTIGVIPGIGGPLSGKVGLDPMLSTSRTSNLKATGETKRENYVTATIGARVLQVLPGGTLELGGIREVRVNDETQYMVVRGIVRAKDIASDNSVESTQLADSKIEYYGQGTLADKQTPGWLTRLLDNIWPF